jgi:ABC-type branched-subunit amino acid transport system ATPase component
LEAHSRISIGSRVFLNPLEVLENGAIALEGTGKELLANAHVKKAFFGM